MKYLIPLMSALLLSLPLAAQDINVAGSLDDYLLSTGGQDEVSSEYLATLKASFTAAFSEESQLVLSGRGDLTLDLTNGSDPLLEGDIDRLYYDYSSDKLNLRAGRFTMSDSTGYIMNLHLDGLEASYQINPQIELNLKTAYSGLTFDSTSDLVRTLEELAGDETLAPPRVIWGFQGQYGNTQGISVRANSYGQVGLDDLSQDLQTWYAGAGTTLPFRDIIVKADYSYGGGTTKVTAPGGDRKSQTLSSHLVYASLRYYPLELRDRGLSLLLSGLYTSGDQYKNRELPQPGGYSTVTPSDTSNMFTPIGQSILGKLMNTQPGNIIRGDLAFTYIPVKGSFNRNLLSVSLGTSVYARAADGPVYGTTLNGESNEAYLATEIRGDMSFRPFSDLGIKVEGALLIPNSEETMKDSRDEQEWNLGVYASLGF